MNAISASELGNIIPIPLASQVYYKNFDTTKYRAWFFTTGPQISFFIILYRSFLSF